MPDPVPVHIHGNSGRLGVLITNLGTPDAPEPAALRRYLGEFLWDPRVVDLPRPLWWLILHGIILRIRPRRSARLYREVWTPEGSPLLAISTRQAEALQERLQGPAGIRVRLGMRYGNPSIRKAMEQLRADGVRRLLVLPLYPQYSATTTASTFDAVAAVLRTWPWMPELRMVTGYHAEPAYISAVANSIRAAWAERPPAERLLFSFHGIPKRYLLSGDPYHCFCHASARLVAEQLGLEESRWGVVFQSRFGREEWLQPYADQTLKALGTQGLESIDMVCPGFSADCLETLEEIAGQMQQLFTEAGGKRFRYIPALNDRADHLDMMAALVDRHITGWEKTISIEALGAARERALAMGASD